MNGYLKIPRGVMSVEIQSNSVLKAYCPLSRFPSVGAASAKKGDLRNRSQHYYSQEGRIWESRGCLPQEQRMDRLGGLNPEKCTYKAMTRASPSFILTQQGSDE